MNQQHIVFEMETADPDDFLTLLWLADHPTLKLVGVLATPGGEDQVRIIRWALSQLGREYIPVGIVHPEGRWATEWGKKQRVSEWHYKVYGEGARQYDLGPVAFVELGDALLDTLITAYPDLTLLTGAAPKTLGNWLKYRDGKLRRWVMQGCFAGDNLVAPEDRLPKFDGKLKCPSYNPGGDPKATMAALASDRIERRLFVSKNVCHGVRYDDKMATDTLIAAGGTMSLLGLSMLPIRRGLQLMFEGLEYTRGNRGGADVIPWEMESEKRGEGKALHDLVAGAVCLDESVCRFKEVTIYRDKGEWGAIEAGGPEPSNTFISVGFDRGRFIRALSR